MKIYWHLSIGVVFLATAVSMSQPPRGPFPGDGQRPLGPPRTYSAQEIQSRLQRFEAMIKQCDANGDGVVDPREIPRDQRYLYERSVQRFGLDPNAPIPVARLRELTMQRYSQAGSPGTPGSSSGGPSGVSGWVSDRGAVAPGSDTMAKPVGFGAGATSGSSVSGFGSPSAQSPAAPATTTPATTAGAAATAWSGSAPGASTPSPGSASAGPPPSSSALNAEREQRIRRYAEYMFRNYDTNKNGVLDKDEWSTRRPDLKAADRNNDDAISSEELSTWLVDYTQKRYASRGEGSSTSTTGTPGGSTASGANSAGPAGATGSAGGPTQHKYYRAVAPAERLPPGLPEWFARKDANGDGQVSMAEYSSTWSDDIAAEFAKYDVNNDGVITPAECLEATKR